MAVMGRRHARGRRHRGRRGADCNRGADHQPSILGGAGAAGPGHRVGDTPGHSDDIFVEGASRSEPVSGDDCDELAAALVGMESEARSPTHQPPCHVECAGDPGFHALIHGVTGDAARQRPGPPELPAHPSPRGAPAHQRRRGSRSNPHLLAPHGAVRIHERRLTHELRHGRHRRRGRVTTPPYSKDPK